MAEKKLLLIVNPVSGRIRISSSLFDIIKVFSDGGFRVTVKMTTARGDATKIVAELGDQHDVVVLCGGDGTLNEGIMGVLSAGLTVPVGYIPCGTTNDFAASLGIERENLKQAALNIVNGKAVPIDIGDFGGMRYFTYIASFGAFTGTSYNVPQVNKNMFGHLAYVMEGLKDLPNIKPIFARVTMDGVSMEDEFIFGSVSNATSIGGMVKIDSDKVDFSVRQGEVHALLGEKLFERAPDSCVLRLPHHRFALRGGPVNREKVDRVKAELRADGFKGFAGAFVRAVGGPKLAGDEEFRTVDAAFANRLAEELGVVVDLHR